MYYQYCIVNGLITAFTVLITASFGNEGQGLAEAVRARCSAELRIPQPGGGESLNVAAAAAVCLYESARQRAVRG